MSYPGFQGYGGSYGSSHHNQNAAYAPNRTSSAVTSTSTNPTYQQTSHSPQYTPSAYSWPDLNQSGYATMSGNTQNYGNTGWKDQQTQQSIYDYQRSQTTYTTATTTDHSRNDWHGSNTQPQAHASTQGLSNLAYASGLDAQGQQAHDNRDRAIAQSRPSSIQPNAAQREEYDQERVKSPFYGRRYTSSNVGTSQPEQSPSAAHHNLAVSAAAALAGAIGRQYNNSSQQSAVSTQQYQASPSSIANIGNQNSTVTPVGSQHQRQPPSSQDNKSRVQPQTQSQPSSNVRAQSPRNLTRYETLETHRYSHTNNPNMTLPLPSPIKNLQQKSSYGATQRPTEKNTEAGVSSEQPATSNVATTTGRTTQPPNGISGQNTHEPAAPMPTFIDPSQVFNPYHKEHERQKQEEAERARRASIEASKASTNAKEKDASTNQPATDTTINTVLASKEQAPRAQDADKGSMSSSHPGSSSVTAKESGEVDMAAEMKAMMQRMREWKNKDPSLFQKLWEDMKKGGSGTQPTRGPTPSQSPQPTQATPLQPAQTQSSQPAQPHTSPVPQTLSQNHTPAPPDSSTASPKFKRHWDQTMVFENNEEGLPDLGHFPAERRTRRTKKQIAEDKAEKAEAKQPAHTPHIHQPQTANKTQQNEKREEPKQVIPQPPPTVETVHMSTSPHVVAPTKPVEKLKWSSQTTQQPPPATIVAPMAAPTQPLPQTTPNGGTIWPEAKRKALADAAQKALMGLPANKDKSITAADIHALLEQNPSYIELCAKLEARGLAFHRGQFARFLLNNVPDLASPSQTQNKPSQQPGVSAAPAITSPPNSVPQVVAAPIPTPNVSTQHSHPPPHPSPYVQYRPPPAAAPKVTPNRPAKSRLGVPSPKIPAPVPGSKEAKARKRDFSELVDLTQLSDDEDYVMPRKQARYEASPDTPELSIPSSSVASTARPMSSMQRPSYNSLTQNPYDQPRSAAHVQIDPQAQPSIAQYQSRVSSRPVPILPQKSRQLLAKPLNKAEALRKSYYDPKTVARDILIAAGRHPREHPLNAHLAGLLGKHIDLDSDLSTFDWDTVDPGGPPMPEVQVVDIPAGPPRWTLGQRGKARGAPIGTFDPPARGLERTKSSKHGEAGNRKTSDVKPNGGKSRESRAHEDDEKESDRGMPREGQIPEVQPSLARLSSQAKSLLEDSIRIPKPKSALQPTRLRQSHNVDETSSKTLSPPPALIALDAPEATSTPHRPQSKTPIKTPTIATSPSSQSQLTHKRGPGRPRKSSVIMESPLREPDAPRRRGRPPGSKTKSPSAAMLKKVTNSSGIQVSIPARRRSTSPPQYNIYACQWRKCDAKLHNLPTLRKHMARVHKIADDQIQREGQPCWWKQCRTLERRGEEFIPSVTFNSTSDWLEHIESDHLHPLGMELGDGPSTAQTGKPINKPFEVSKYFYHPPKFSLTTTTTPMFPLSIPKGARTRTSSHTDPQTLSRDRTVYLSDTHGRIVTAPSTKSTIADYPSDTLVLSPVKMDPESNIPNRAFSKAHGNDKMEVRQRAVETLVALQKHKERVGPGLDRGGCTLVNGERRGSLLEGEGMARVVEGDY